MNKDDYKETLKILKISNPEAAGLLGVNLRTAQRWINGDVEIPKTTENLLKAWMYINSLGLPWRPDGHSISEVPQSDIQKQVTLYIQHTVDLDVVLKRVLSRGGPSAPWKVDLSAKKAVLGPIWVSFYLSSDGTFSPQSYGRKDKEADLSRDLALLEDAYACIAGEIALAKSYSKTKDWVSVNT